MAIISVDHPISLHDQPLKIRLHDFAPNERTDVVATRVDLFGQQWRSWAQFITNASGCADLSTQASQAGIQKRDGGIRSSPDGWLTRTSTFGYVGNPKAFWFEFPSSISKQRSPG